VVLRGTVRAVSQRAHPRTRDKNHIAKWLQTATNINRDKSHIATSITSRFLE
jgi:hypothetical protein